MPLVSLQGEGPVAVITLENPPQNRINETVGAELADAIDKIEAGEFRAVLLRANGPDFSFGGDIMNWPDMTMRQLRATFDQYMSIFNRFERLPLPVIAAVQGLCFGGGLELAIRADMIFAAESAAFGHPEQSIGIVTVLGGIYRVAERAGRSFATEWALTSERVPAATMMQRGVVNRSACRQRTHAGIRGTQGATKSLGGVGRCRRGQRDARYRHTAVRNGGCPKGHSIRGDCLEGGPTPTCRGF